MGNISILDLNSTYSNAAIDATIKISQICPQWNAYILASNGFYIGWFWVFIVAGIIGRFWNYQKEFILETGYKDYKIEINLIRSIQNIALGVIFIRMFILYYAVRLGL
jgi:hypothetical protein